MRRIAAALVHYPVYDRQREIVSALKGAAVDFKETFTA